MIPPDCSLVVSSIGQSPLDDDDDDNDDDDEGFISLVFNYNHLALSLSSLTTKKTSTPKGSVDIVE
ncbi:hypothetical protein DERP_002053 [Dermatophagoides pteronyssinus]|uniref:Uncharacterized protein n=1 Tax=Dermatophagoides pteronyssinus TaxID=6956 RepID=A0ABQ8JHA6_DERPT|nr:hypothetical protein DERP_002053 [Dermatophagoides pteronyssinus]